MGVVVHPSPVSVPDILPVLSRGKHRNARKGACFMELASYLAGERWSDAPRCTHPLLAALARAVNDSTSDAARPLLAPLIPSVIGLTGDDPRIDVRIALRCATLALPVAAAGRQRALAVAALSGLRALTALDAAAVARLEPACRKALATAPDAARWAHDFTRDSGTSPAAYRKHGAPTAVRIAAEGVGKACVRDPDTLLRELLEAAIGECESAVGRQGLARVEAPAWSAACQLTGVH